MLEVEIEVVDEVEDEDEAAGAGSFPPAELRRTAATMIPTTITAAAPATARPRRLWGTDYPASRRTVSVSAIACSAS